MVRELIGKKLKKMRLKNDMTIEILAHKSQVSSNMISRIERGLTTPSVEILMKLAGAFGMSISYFVEEAEKGSTVVYTRAGEGEPIFFFQDKHQIISLTQGLRDPGFTVFYDTIEPGCDSGEGNMVHVGEEFALVVQGSLDLIIEEHCYHLQPGDSVCFKANLPHRWVNTSSGQTRVLWVVSPAPDVAQQHA
ncbi:helix-turn-helix domain-containing protein [Desulfuromonas thiophila]|uniref:Transcriptional regulator, XRE family with cupin sensor n=1 Tax=Desulfuromonas thiophila TaxID=57664 RepID=A0A1G7B678_9BACT|nr:cupin domain-containing protein [Desulfuromonas thiophila]MDD3802126.1 cupin domain-containing protein [Desulfuromonas thiophila]SDE22579.1 transcriptional regulator, XRE family with cupin sensor [Desulfuromonas thiophila]